MAFDDGLNNLLMDNNTEFKQIQELKYYTDNKYTNCDTCEKKCHET